MTVAPVHVQCRAHQLKQYVMQAALEFVLCALQRSNEGVDERDSGFRPSKVKREDDCSTFINVS